MRDYTGILRLPQLYHYLFLVLFCGMAILFMSSSLPWVPKSYYNSEYMTARNVRSDRELSEAKAFIAGLAELRPSNNGSTGKKTLNARMSTGPGVDPPWMRAYRRKNSNSSGTWEDISQVSNNNRSSNRNRWAPAALAFVPEEKQVHPYLPRYVIENSRLCQNQGRVVNDNASDDPVLDVVLLIHSQAGNIQRRRVLRETWAGSRVLLGVKVATVFVLGRDIVPVASAMAQNTDNNKNKGKQNKKKLQQPVQAEAPISTQMLINTEHANHGDIVQGDFLDTPGNRTLKALTGLRWVNDNCLPHAGNGVLNSRTTNNNNRGVRFVLKADDDVFVNVFALVEHFLQHLFSSATKQEAGRDRGGGDGGVVMCEVRKMDASRVLPLAAAARTSAKTEQTWAKLFKPVSGNWTFCAGHLVVMTADVVPALYRASFLGPHLPDDDVLVYGLLPVLAAEVGNREGGNGGNDFLRYLNVSDNFALDIGELLKLYSDFADQGVPGIGASVSPLSLGGRVSSDVGFIQLWNAVLRTLSPWASTRAAITKLRGSVPLGLL